MVPPKDVNPPLPNCPALPISSVAPLLSSIPLKLTSPPLRVIVPKPLVVVATFKFSMLLLPTAIFPSFKNIFSTNRVPAVTCKLPLILLENESGLIISVWSFVLPMMVPSLNTDEVSFCVIEPKPWTVTPLSNCKVCGVRKPATKEPPAVLMVALPEAVVVIRWKSELAKFKAFMPILNTAPSSNVRSLSINRSPIKFKVPLMVTPSSVPSFDFKAAALPLLISVPLWIVPPSELNPPLPNCPLSPTSSVASVLSRTPLKFTSPPVPVRVIEPKPLVLVLTFKLRILFPPTVILPPELVIKVFSSVSVPSETFTVP